MIPMPAGLVRGLWRAVECPSMTIGGCLSSRRTFSTLMELWTRLWSLFQSLRQCYVCVCVHICTCACVSNVNVRVFHFSQLKSRFFVLFPRKCSGLQSRKNSKVAIPSHTHILVLHQLFNLAVTTPSSIIPSEQCK